jgi:hypothetical protein
MPFRLLVYGDPVFPFLDLLTRFWEVRSFSLKSDGSVWESEVLHHGKHPFFHTFLRTMLCWS